MLLSMPITSDTTNIPIEETNTKIEPVAIPDIVIGTVTFKMPLLVLPLNHKLLLAYAYQAAQSLHTLVKS